MVYDHIETNNGTGKNPYQLEIKTNGKDIFY